MTMTLTARQQTMRDSDLWWCPPWCAQIEGEEDGHTQHIGHWDEMVTSDGATTIRVRPRAAWEQGEGGNDQVEFELVGEGAVTIDGNSSDAVAAVWLRWANGDLDDLETFVAMCRDAAEKILAWHNEDDPEDWIEAYPGAARDAGEEAA